MDHTNKIAWMAQWAAKHGMSLALAGECGFGRDCVGVQDGGTYPDYQWYDKATWERADENGDVWTPENAYHKHPCVAVLGRGESAEAELYEWLVWFDANGFSLERGASEPQPGVPLALAAMLGQLSYSRMVRKVNAPTGAGGGQ